MVLPLDGQDGPPPMMAPVGPPPAFMARRLRKIKGCLIAQIIGLVLQLSAGIPLLPDDTLDIVLNALNALLIVVVGIFLLKDDPVFGRIHSCLVNTFCSTCAEQCQGGMPCMCSWFFICLFAGILGLLPIDGSKLTIIIVGCSGLADPSKATGSKAPRWGFEVGSTMWKCFFGAYVLAAVFTLLGQLVGGWQGLKGFQEMTAWQQEGLLGGDASAGGGARDFGGGQIGAAPQAASNSPAPYSGTGYRTQRETRDEENPGAGQPTPAPQQQGFQAFSGQGNRLGG
mmetsp:Transcript_18696/g.33794  ORF Transcript_18696/g.33794 Transcript_18696/m.33794 type:complete len:284 (-) Transcript_18696:148-999(-)